MKKLVRILLAVLLLAALSVTECPLCGHIIHTETCEYEVENGR